MFHIVRAISGLLGGATGVLSGFLAIYLAVASPHDQATKDRFILAAAVLCGIAIVGSAVFAACDLIRAHRQDKREEEWDRILRDLASAAKVRASTSPVPDPETLRQGGFDLAKDMRSYLDSVPEGLTLDRQRDIVFPYFLNTYYPRLSAMKDRFRATLPRGSVAPTTEWLPTSKDQIEKIVENLEREAGRVDRDVLF
jgi:hypothetical protein